MTQRVAIVGGGISGLATAYRIEGAAREAGLSVDVQVLEREDVAGGKIGSFAQDGFLCEAGPNGYLNNEPATDRLIDDLKLRDRVLRSHDRARTRYILRRGVFHKLEMNPARFMRSPLLSLRGRLRVASEMFVPGKKGDREETVAQFGRRRLGQEFVDVMLDSMVSGIYAGDVNRLSMQAAFPRVPLMEKQYGGLVKALNQRRREARRARVRGQKQETPTAGPAGVLHSFQGGMGEIIQVLAKHLGDRMNVNTVVERVRPLADGYGVTVGGREYEVDAVVLAVPGPAARQLLNDIAPQAAAQLGSIHVAGVHVVQLGFERGQVEMDLGGFGALIPRKEGLRMLGSIWSSSTFAHRAPDGHVLLTSMVGGRHDPQADDLSDDDLMKLVLDEMEPFYGIDGPPAFSKVFRWRSGIPQYELGHLDKVAQARRDLERLPGMFLTGNTVAGVSFNQCIAHAETIASGVVDFLRHRKTAEARA
jgi:oxygen-dependent protoporphyrinogen oxidase